MTIRGRCHQRALVPFLTLAVSAVSTVAAAGAAPEKTAEAPAKAAEAPAKPAEATTNETYETLARNATRTRDVPTLLGAFIDRCDAEPRQLERARCRTTQAYLREVLPTRTFISA